MFGIYGQYVDLFYVLYVHYVNACKLAHVTCRSVHDQVPVSGSYRGGGRIDRRGRERAAGVSTVELFEAGMTAFSTSFKGVESSVSVEV